MADGGINSGAASGASGAPTNATNARRVGELPKTRPPEEAPWLAGLVRDKRNKLKTTYANVVAVLRGDTAFGRFSFNERTLQPEFNRQPIEEGMMLRLFEEIELRWGLTPGFETFVRAVMCVARECSVEPVRDELERLVWDGVPRLDTVASRFLRNSGALEAVLIRKTVIAAIARALDPGCQVDTTCVLTGGQGALKSSFWRTLAGAENFGDSAIDVANKDGLLQMRASWFHELPEIDGITTRRHADQVKAFLTVRVDMFRPPYGRSVARFPRATVLVGTTNRDDYLADPTGSRRFWTVEVNADLPTHQRQSTKIDVEALAAERDQLLAEAVEAYRAWRERGCKRSECLWWLTREEDAQLAEQSLEHQESDVWEGPIESWLAAQSGPRDAMQILVGALQFEKAKATRADQTRVGRIMHGLGYSIERRREGDSRRRVYIKREAGYAREAQQSIPVETTGDAESPSADDDSPTDANDADPIQDGDAGPTWSNRSNMDAGEVGPLSPHSRPGWSNWSNRSNLIPYVGTRAPAPARAPAPKCVGPVGPVGPDCKFPRQTGPTSDAACWTTPGMLDHPAAEPGEPAAPTALATASNHANTLDNHDDLNDLHTEDDE